jgi:hypothetical protein
LPDPRGNQTGDRGRDQSGQHVLPFVLLDPVPLGPHRSDGRVDPDELFLGARACRYSSPRLAGTISSGLSSVRRSLQLDCDQKCDPPANRRATKPLLTWSGRRDSNPRPPPWARWLRHTQFPGLRSETPAQGPHGYQSVSVRAIPLAARLRHARRGWKPMLDDLIRCGVGLGRRGRR